MFVVRKLRAVLVPFSKKNWRRTLAHDEASPTSPGVQPAQRKFARPVDDENAPDLYLPMMGFLTFALVASFIKGTAGNFEPDVLPAVITSCGMFQLFEVALLKVPPVAAVRDTEREGKLTPASTFPPSPGGAVRDANTELIPRAVRVLGVQVHGALCSVRPQRVPHLPRVDRFQHDVVHAQNDGPLRTRGRRWRGRAAPLAGRKLWRRRSATRICASRFCAVAIRLNLVLGVRPH